MDEMELEWAMRFKEVGVDWTDLRNGKMADSIKTASATQFK